MPLINRLKTLVCGLLVIALLWTAPVLAAGTLPLAMAQQIDVNGRPLAGCQVSFFVAGTVASPQNSYSDFGLSQNPNPILSCDQAGRVPMFWLADGLVHVRMTDAAGTPVIDTTMQVLGPSSGGGGGGGTVDPTTILSTGDMKIKYGTGPLPGFARSNGLTIGNVASGGTERANADTQALFIYLYGVDSSLVVSGGRTGNALNDFNAGKTIAMPDWRGYAIAALGDMGNSDAGRLTVPYFGCSGIVLGCAGGTESRTLTLPQLPPGITSTGSNSISVASSASVLSNGGSIITLGNGGAPSGVSWVSIPTVGPLASSGTNSISVTSNNTSGNAHATASPMKLATIYIKL